MKKIPLLALFILHALAAFAEVDSSSFFGFSLGNSYSKLASDTFYYHPFLQYQKYVDLTRNNIPSDIQKVAISLSQKSNTILGITAQSSFANDQDCTNFLDKYFEDFSKNLPSWKKSANKNERALSNGISEIIFRHNPISNLATNSTGLIIFQPTWFAWDVLSKRANVEHEESILDGSFPASPTQEVEIPNVICSKPSEWPSIERAGNLISELENRIPSPHPSIPAWVDRQEIQLISKKQFAELDKFQNTFDYLHCKFILSLRSMKCRIGLIRSNLIPIEKKWTFALELALDLQEVTQKVQFQELLNSKQFALKESDIQLFYTLMTLPRSIIADLDLPTSIMIREALIKKK